jgi:cardiolipin synthase
MTSVLGTILDPAADKALVGTLVVTLTMRGLLPREFLTHEKSLFLMLKLVPLAIIIVGRDMLLSLSAFYIRYTSLPHPVSYITFFTLVSCALSALEKTFQRYWDFSIPSAEVRPTTISKANTALQLLLLGSTTISPLLPGATVGLGLYLKGLQ